MPSFDSWTTSFDLDLVVDRVSWSNRRTGFKGGRKCKASASKVPQPPSRCSLPTGIHPGPKKVWRWVGPEYPPLVIAEIGINHEGTATIYHCHSIIAIFCPSLLLFASAHACHPVLALSLPLQR